MNGWVKWGRGLSDVVFPPSCVECGKLVEPGRFRHICRDCARLVKTVHTPHCQTCGHPFHGEVEGERLCPHCEGIAPAYQRGLTLVLLKGPTRALVHELKYRRGLYVLEDMGALLRESDEAMARLRGAFLVPVPLHPRKLRERGYNQSALLATKFAQTAGAGARVVNALVRVEDTDTQTVHNRRERMGNLKNAFALNPTTHLNPGQHLILIDDVFTTGSTLNNCARVLRRAGCLNLDVITFGHG